MLEDDVNQVPIVDPDVWLGGADRTTALQGAGVPRCQRILHIEGCRVGYLGHHEQDTVERVGAVGIVECHCVLLPAPRGTLDETPLRGTSSRAPLWGACRLVSALSHARERLAFP